MEPLQVATVAAKQTPTVFRVLSGLFKAPARISALEATVVRLEAAIAAQADPRPMCLSCGEGRVQVDYSISAEQRSPEAHGNPADAHHVGSCSKCHARWYINGARDLIERTP